MDVHLREILKKGALALGLRVGGAGLNFLFAVYSARILGGEDYGLFMLSLTIVTILSVMVRLGLDNVIVRNVSASCEARNIPLAKGYFQRSVLIVICSGFVVGFIVFLLNPTLSSTAFSKPELNDPMIAMLWLLIPYSLALLIAEALKGLREIKDATITQAMIMPGLTVTILFVGGFWANWELKDVIYIYVLSASVAALFAWQRWHARVSSAGVAINPPFGALLRSGFPLLLATSGALIMSWTDTLVLGMYKSAEAVAIYTAASRTALLTSLILYAVNSISAPKFAALYAGGDLETLANLAQKTTVLMTILVITPTLVLLFYPELILRLFGAEFAAGGMALAILALGQFVNVACGSVGYLLSMTGHETVMRTIMLTSAAFNILASLMLVRYMGMQGVAIATAISTVLWNVWMMWAVKRYLGFWTISPILFSPRRYMGI